MLFSLPDELTVIVSDKGPTTLNGTGVNVVPGVSTLLPLKDPKAKTTSPVEPVGPSGPVAPVALAIRRLRLLVIIEANSVARTANPLSTG